jgi:hypothetical protein
MADKALATAEKATAALAASRAAEAAATLRADQLQAQVWLSFFAFVLLAMASLSNA